MLQSLCNVGTRVKKDGEEEGGVPIKRPKRPLETRFQNTRGGSEYGSGMPRHGGRTGAWEYGIAADTAAAPVAPSSPYPL
jgi:hypothetical protein